jgi:hypothetical protein
VGSQTEDHLDRVSSGHLGDFHKKGASAGQKPLGPEAPWEKGIQVAFGEKGRLPSSSQTCACDGRRREGGHDDPEDEDVRH